VSRDGEIPIEVLIDRIVAGNRIRKTQVDIVVELSCTAIVGIRKAGQFAGNR